MNNDYYNFNPNNLMRSIPATRAVPMNGSLPRLSSILPRGGLTSSILPRATSSLGTSALGSTSKLTFSSFLNGASKTLGVINQAIPVFYQVKPVWNNAKTMFRVVKEINNTKDTNQTPSTNSAPKKEDSNSPTFFI